MRPRDLASGQGQGAQVSAVDDGADQLLLDHDVATWRDDTVAEQAIQDVFAVDDNLLVTVLDSKEKKQSTKLKKKKSHFHDE